MVCDLDQADEGFWQSHADRDCWIFGDTLEHLKQTARQAYASALKASLLTMRAAPPELGELID